MNNDFTKDPDLVEAELAALARTLTVSDTHFDQPPPGLWAGIEARVAAGEPATPHKAPSTGTVVPMRRRWPLVLGAAASLLIAVGVWSVVFQGDGGGVDEVAGVALSNDGLEPDGASSSADAVLVRLADGQYALDIQVADAPSTPGTFLELWIIDTKVEGMYSLGPLHGSGRYRLPENVDPAAFPVVDISIEPTDGVPTHSGSSILRGQLDV